MRGGPTKPLLHGGGAAQRRRWAAMCTMCTDRPAIRCCHTWAAASCWCCMGWLERAAGHRAAGARRCSRCTRLWQEGGWRWRHARRPQQLRRLGCLLWRPWLLLRGWQLRGLLRHHWLGGWSQSWLRLLWLRGQRLGLLQGRLQEWLGSLVCLLLWGLVLLWGLGHRLSQGCRLLLGRRRWRLCRWLRLGLRCRLRLLLCDLRRLCWLQRWPWNGRRRCRNCCRRCCWRCCSRFLACQRCCLLPLELFQLPPASLDAAACTAAASQAAAAGP